MQKFELGFAFRGTTAPEVKKVLEAGSLREAMLKVIDEHGGKDVVLVTHAHYFREPKPPRAGATVFMFAPECAA